jgi:hypothetical protein
LATQKLATVICERGPPSSETRTAGFSKVSTACNAAAANEALPPSRRAAPAGSPERDFTRLMTSPPIPNDATLTKNLDSSSPPPPTKRTRPASITRVSPSRRARAASAARAGTLSVRRKSPPVPLGSSPNSASDSARSIPFATSEMVPSPPQAMTNLRPARASRSATSTASPGLCVNATSKGPKCRRTADATPGHASPVAPLADAGLTMISGSFDIFGLGFFYELARVASAGDLSASRLDSRARAARSCSPSSAIFDMTKAPISMYVRAESRRS